MVIRVGILSLCCHLAAGFCTLAAGVGALPAMVGLVVGTFGCAGFAYFGTQAAELRGRLPVDTHHFGSGIAKGGTFHIQLDAVLHHIYIRFLQAGGGAAVAHRGALKAGFYTLLVR